MSYAPSSDFFALLRTTPSGVRLASAPGLDIIMAALARAGMVSLWVNVDTAPNANQATTVWLKTSSSSWAAESSVYLWDATQLAYVQATPALWAALFQATKFLNNENDPAAGGMLDPLQTGQLFTNSGTAAIGYTLPSAVANPGVTYEFAMTQNGSLAVLTLNSGLPTADTLRWGTTTTTIGAASGYVGSYLKVRSINGQWFVINAEGTWTLS